MFDLILTPLHFTAGRALSELPGFQATAAPRRADRHRTTDLLAVYLSGSGGESAESAFALLSEVYFRTGGTVTSAIKEAVEALNENLLARTERAAVAMVMNLCVIRGSLVYIAHAGPTHTYVLSNGGVSEFFDPSSGGRGLGISRAVPLRFFQATVADGDALLFCAEPPADWPAALTTSQWKSPGAADLRAGLLRAQTGSGQVRVEPLPVAARSVTPAAPVEAPAQPPAQIAAEPPYEIPTAVVEPAEPAPAPISSQSAESAPVQVELAPEALTEQPAPSLPTTSVVSQARRRVEERRAQSAAAAARPAAEPRPGLGGLLRRVSSQEAAPAHVLGGAAAAEPAAPARPQGPSPAARSLGKRLAAIFRGARKARRSVGSLLPRVAPTETAFNPTTGTLFFIAVAIPLVVVAIATAVYFRSGASEQRVAYVQQARIYAERAASQEDVTQRRANWEQVMYWVNKSEEFGSDEETIALRRKAQVAMDSLDGIVRLDLAPAFTGVLADSINISRMAATNSELYLLDSVSGRILRMNRTGRTYEYDPNFSCGPGPNGAMIVGPLVGLSILPANAGPGGNVLAIDATGNLLYCQAGELPLAKSLSPPENNWGRITAMAVENGDLYVLDLQNNAVWRFDGTDYNFNDRARLFFGNEVPNMADVIDINVYEDDLYLLRGSGMMTVCSSTTDFSPTRCNDPATYGDSSGALESYSDAGFIQMLTTEPPDPSLYILDRKGPALYHFSLRLNFTRELRQDPEQEREFPLPKKQVTAFAMSPNRVVFLAFANQIVFGAIP